LHSIVNFTQILGHNNIEYIGNDIKIEMWHIHP